MVDVDAVQIVQDENPNNSAAWQPITVGILLL